MLRRAITIGVALLVAAVPLAAQQQGTIEFGGFASNNSFDNSLGMNSAWGGGARVGAFLLPRVSLEFEGNGLSASRTLGRADVNTGILSGRLLYAPLKVGRLSLLLGAGVDHTDTEFLESYGYHGLLGAKLALSSVVGLRADGIQSHMANGGGTNTAIHLGLTLYRKPKGIRTVETRIETRTEIREVPAAPVAQRPDSVSAAETRRLRDLELSYQRLRDSLARIPAPSSDAAAMATMRQMIFFRHDQSSLSDSAKAILREKVPVFNANPEMLITIIGFASKPGTETYNMALGLRRAAESKAYLVSRGINANRIEIATRGEGQLRVEGPGEAADAANRRSEFSILVTESIQNVPRK